MYTSVCSVTGERKVSGFFFFSVAFEQSAKRTQQRQDGYWEARSLLRTKFFLYTSKN